MTDEITKEATPRPWHLSGVRFQMNCANWQSINHDNPDPKKSVNVALVGFDPRTGEGRADALFILTLKKAGTRNGNHAPAG